MAVPSTGVSEPVPITKIAGRFLLFDINVVAHLRRTHHICGVLIGSIPQVPQQNVFLGLPVELLAEEANLLVKNGIGYIVDDAARHKNYIRSMSQVDRSNYLKSLNSRGRKIQEIAEENSCKRAEEGLAKQAVLRASKEALSSPVPPRSIRMTNKEPHTRTGIFFGNVDSAGLAAPITAPPTLATTSSAPTRFAITPTTSDGAVSARENSGYQSMLAVPLSYPLFSYLHFHNYFLTPGLRFGCDYTVYPGDPLRFHSHFLAVSHKWNEQIPLIDLVGGGRLGTGVKKGFLIGGEIPSVFATEAHSVKVRVFCIEWGGM